MWILFLVLFIGSFFAMEFVAWFTHKYVMHGFLWKWHESHHTPHPDNPFFEKNDRFFLVFAVPSALSMIFGFSNPELSWLIPIGFGIAAYGLAYFLIHDVYIHQRFTWFRQLDGWYSRAILKAHGKHHAKRTKDSGESFGLFVISRKYFK